MRNFEAFLYTINFMTHPEFLRSGMSCTLHLCMKCQKNSIQPNVSKSKYKYVDCQSLPSYQIQLGSAIRIKIRKMPIFELPPSVL